MITSDDKNPVCAGDGSSCGAHDWRCDVLDMILALTKRKFTVLGIMLAATVIGIAMASMAEPYYSASASFVLLPREKPIMDLSVQSASVETSEDAAKRSNAATLTLPPNPDLYTTLIKSTDVCEGVSESLKADARLAGLVIPGPRAIRDSLTVEASEEGVIKITARMGHPQIAAAVVNALVEQCQQASQTIERQLILQQAGYLGTAIEQAEQRLGEARSRLEQYSGRFGIADPDIAAARSSHLIATLNDTEARLSREIERMLVHRTTQDPAVTALIAEREQVIERRTHVQQNFCSGLSEAAFAKVAAEWDAIAQDVTLRQDLLMSMRARHDVFSIRADQPSGNIAVIRGALAPSSPAGPSRRKALVFALLAGSVVAGGACVVLDQVQRAFADGEAGERLRAIGRCFVMTEAKPEAVRSSVQTEAK